MRDNRRPDTILIADDTEVNRSVLLDLFCREYEIAEAENGGKRSASSRKRRTGWPQCCWIW